jgi:hypothetical protein
MDTQNGVGFAWPFWAPISSTGEMRLWSLSNHGGVLSARLVLSNHGRVVSARLVL